MRNINLDRGWNLLDSEYSFVSILMGAKPREVNLPHDFMIENDVKEDAPASNHYGFYTAATKSYTKELDIPVEWKNDEIWVHFDGVMGQAVPELNGTQFGVHHYGYTPFDVDITNTVDFGGRNRFTLNVHPGQEPNSRWYPGAGIFRSVTLCHAPKLHVAMQGGIYSRTDRLETEDGVTTAYLTHEVKVTSHLSREHLVRVAVRLIDDATGEVVASRETRLSVPANTDAVARLAMSVEDPKLWDDENPCLYRVEARISDLGAFTTHLVPDMACCADDCSEVLFGIRTITVDVKHGLRVNGKVKNLAGGCVHHDNGLLGAASYYDAEYRRVRKMKEAGYNAIRTSHNPPSEALLEACDRLGMYLFDETFDMWMMGKTAGDYSLYFKDHWREDMAAHIMRDRSHPSVALWSTGNEIIERGGLTGGYKLASDLAQYARFLDPSRPITNSICSFWNGLDDAMAMEGMKAFAALKNKFEEKDTASDDEDSVSLQNAAVGGGRIVWEDLTEAFAQQLDVVGYNYMDSLYENDMKQYPDRVIVGSETYPKDIAHLWSLVKKYPSIIGDFTWTAWDYIGEAGIGKALYLEDGDPRLAAGPMAISSHSSEFPWRTANDADFDINGRLLPQGVYRSVVWGSKNTGLFTYDPDVFDKKELVGNWGWPYIYDRWTWSGREGRPIRVVCYSSADEVELLVNGKSVGRQPAGEAQSFTATFETIYEPGEITAVSYTDGEEISRATLETTGAPAGLRLTVDTAGTDAVTDGHVPSLRADGHSLAYVLAEVVDSCGRVVPYATVDLEASVTGAGDLAGFGSANPASAENYTTGKFSTFRGRAMAILRSGVLAGDLTLTVSGAGWTSEITIPVKD